MRGVNYIWKIGFESPTYRLCFSFTIQDEIFLLISFTFQSIAYMGERKANKMFVEDYNQFLLSDNNHAKLQVFLSRKNK